MASNGSGFAGAGFSAEGRAAPPLKPRTGKGRGGEKSPAPGPGGYLGYHREPQDPAEGQPQGDQHHPHDLHCHHLLARSGFHQLSAHAGQGPALQPGDMHLGEADPGRDLVLVQILEEP
jgi:hypothetical protein